MSPEAFTEKLNEALGERLIAVALYGSAAADDALAPYSDVNLMVVCDRLGTVELDILGPLAVEWSKLGNPPPLLFTNERLLNSSHVFPIELLDIKENHRILFGSNVLRTLPINQENLQFQLEHELKGKLIQLREGYLLSNGGAEDVLDLMLQSLSAFQIMLKASLRFYSVNVPTKKREAVAQLSNHVHFDLSVFEDLQGMRDGVLETPEGKSAVAELFGRYLEAIERAADLIAGLAKR